VELAVERAMRVELRLASISVGKATTPETTDAAMRRSEVKETMLELSSWRLVFALSKSSCFYSLCRDQMKGIVTLGGLLPRSSSFHILGHEDHSIKSLGMEVSILPVYPWLMVVILSEEVMAKNLLIVDNHKHF
jgi:hypothetical protein